MRPTTVDGIVLIYNFAAVLSGAYANAFLPIDERAALFGTAFLLAILWTVYFRYGMIPRLAERIDTDDVDEDGWRI